MLNKKALAATAPGVEPVYVEEVFSTYLWTGNDTSQTITNGIDLSGEGGLVWTKGRDYANQHNLFDTVRGATKLLQTSSTNAESTDSLSLTSFSSTGFALGSSGITNSSPQKYVGWTFRKAEKFFDVVTYTGNGSNRTIAHNLGSTPGCIIVKRTDTTGGWITYHRGLTSASYVVALNSTDAESSSTTFFNGTAPTSTVFSLGTSTSVNANGGTYVAYLFAHDAGGFGDDGDQSVIKCGSVAATGGNVDIELGWEPQWVLVKNASANENWRLLDNMRGITNADTKWLFPNTSGAETSNSGWNELTPTGVRLLGWGSSGNTYVYIAIRRGPMKTPTDATKVFSPTYDSSNLTTNEVVTTGFPVDFVINARTGAEHRWLYDRIRGSAASLKSSDSTTEGTQSGFSFDSNTSVTSLADWSATVVYAFRRAPEFMDVLRYTGNGSAGRTVTHNLGVAPQIIIIKRRDSTSNGRVYFEPLGNTAALLLNSTGASGGGYWNSTSPTSTVFSLSSDASVNTTSATYVAYLFASCPGVSKVGSYTGTGTTLQVDCGFTTGARFVLIKRTDTTGHWQVFDSARGIVSGGNDPWLILSGTTAQSTGNDYLDPYSAGFTITSSAPAAMNASGGTYVYLAIA